ncbi:MAG: hypothetical protein NTW95_02085 [Candidatus Aminicenantes bacterium]|nr:hypothetical protein [Candidatus Aminicenantes bacterium]
MKEKKRKQSARIFSCLFSLLLATVFSIPRLTAQSSKPVTLMEDPGKMRIVYGGDCGSSQKNGEQNWVEIAGKFTAPSWANQATVFLSGWSAEYLEGDEHLGEIGVSIGGITFSGGVLEWKTSGLLADENFDNPYKLCYCYIALFWNDGQVDAKPYHGDGSFDTTTGACTGNLNYAEQKTGDLPMLILDSYVFNKAFAAVNEVAILPRGFNFAFLPYGKTDNHILQIAANFDHTEKYIGYPHSYGHLQAPSLPTKAGQIGLGYVSWQTQSILKDDGGSPDFRFWEHFSALAGDDIGFVQPPYTVRPRLHQNIGCSSHSGGETTESFTVENVPFEYAVPVLTGWSLEYDCPTDQHVLKLGAWLHDILYVKKASDLVGTLSYKVTSILTDDDSEHAHYFTHKVHILGLQATVALPDLLPVSTASDGSFCPKPGTKTLSITIRNQGKVDAAASTTTVEFSPVASVDVVTPAIAAGKEVTIQVTVPTGCYIPNCRFKIRADSKLVIKEANEYNNDVLGECKG